MTLQIDSHFMNNSIVIIKSLDPVEDEDTATTLLNHLKSISNATSPRVEFHDALSKQHVLEILDDVKERAKNGMKPIIHFETHGEKNCGLHISASDEFISWKELADKFREINIVTNNNLGVVMAACFGLYAIKPIHIFEPSPYFVLISSDKEIEVDYINEQIWKFYDALFSTGSLDSAMASIDQQFTPFHAERFFTISVIRYFREACVGDAGRERVDRLVSEVTATLENATQEKVEELRRSAVEFITPNPSAFERISRNFIIDKSKYKVTFEEIMAMVGAAA